MPQIYQSFQEMMEQNKSVIEFLQKKGNGDGVHRAIWESRDEEIIELKKSISMLEIKNNKLIEERASFESDYQLKEKRLLDQEQIIAELHQDEETSMFIINGLKEKIHLKEQECDRMINLIKKSKTYIEKIKSDLTDRTIELKVSKERFKCLNQDQMELIELVKKRDSEIISFQNELEAKNLEYQEQLTKKINEKEKLKNTYEKELKDQNNKYREELQKLISEEEQLRIAAQENIEALNKTHQSELNKVIDNRAKELLERENIINKLEENLGLEKDKSKRFQLELQKAKLFVVNLKNEIEKVRNSTKHYQKLNHKMEAELYRLNGDLSVLQKSRPISWN